MRQYCAEQKYDFVWFCKDIERVYTGKKVNAVDKKKKSEEFKKKKQISGVKVDKLSAAEYQENTSNILRILEQYLDMKRGDVNGKLPESGESGIPDDSGIGDFC